MKSTFFSQIHESLQNISEVWPEQAFTFAPWNELAANCKGIYSKRQNQNNDKSIASSVCIGEEYIDTPSGNLRLPHAFAWAGFKGLNIVDHDVNNSAYACKIMASVLLRIFLQAEPGTIRVHQVDPIRMGAEMKALPLQPETPRLIKEENLLRLLQDLSDEMAQHQVATWLCDTCGDAYSADQRPLHLIAIANWDDLSIHRNGDDSEESESQKLIRCMLETDIAARNGIYFFICSDEAVTNGQLPILTAHDEQHTTLHPHKADKTGSEGIKQQTDLSVSLPTDEELQQLHAGYNSYINGSLEDIEDNGIWLGNSANGLRAKMGTTPHGTTQYFELGLGKAHNAFHALIGGATGSGKSVLLNEIICSLAERYSPQELRMVLLDYKEGTEFAPYTALPHVFALSIGSNPEFGVEVLKWLQQETERRGKLFKQVGVNNITDYRRISGEMLCRYVVVADEFQVLCTDKKQGDEARAILNDLVRRTRSFGINFILATQTLRDGSLEGEAKNQFACRICLQLAENETDYFLATDNDVPAHFNRKGQALLNYSMGMKSGNIPFQSGNRQASNGKYRTTSDIRKCLAALTEKAKAEGCMPTERYIYESDGYAQLSSELLQPAEGFLLGLRNNMKSTPFYLNKRHIDGGVLIVGHDEQKNAALLQQLSGQTIAMYGLHCPIQTPTDYLDGNENYPLTIFSAHEGDVDLAEAVAAWKDAQQQNIQDEVLPSTTAPVMESHSSHGFVGMEDEFSKMMQKLQSNCDAMTQLPTNQAAPSGRGGRRRRAQGRPLIVSVRSVADVKMMESGGFYANDFRVVIYLDLNAYNQMSGNYESGTLAPAQIIVEHPRGTATKVRMGNIIPREK